MTMENSEIVATAAAMPAPADIVSLMLARMADGLDQPELWADFPLFLAEVPGLAGEIAARAEREHPALIAILAAMARAAQGDPAGAVASLQPLALANSQSALVQGAVFWLEGLRDPGNPKYQLAGKVCEKPFEVLDVLDGEAHQCCASWLHQSAGDLGRQDWRPVWNSAEARAVRASMLDGSYRYCNKMACHFIGANELPSRAELAARSPEWARRLAEDATFVEQGPKRVTLAYDRSCNLSCPSCRTEKYAADSATRARFDVLQEQAILPMLKDAELVWITGSGDPFASKNFRHLMERLTAEDYPGLRFQLMTNGMLLNRREWERFPALHGRVAVLRLSLDAASGPTHEAIRRGARWPVMEENMAFMAELRASGQIDKFDIIYTVQEANFHEMGDCIDLAHAHGVDHVWYYRMTNWGTFSDAEYAGMAVFNPAHPRHDAFLEAMRDPRLCDPVARLGDLTDFARA